jgi:hypothetical protein
MTLFRCKHTEGHGGHGCQTRAIGIFTVTVEKVVSFNAETIFQLWTSSVVTGPRGRAWPLWQFRRYIATVENPTGPVGEVCHRSKEHAWHLVMEHNVEK